MRTDSRWSRNFVVQNIRRVYAMRDRIEVIEGDGLTAMRSYADDPSVGCFADPPYVADATGKGHYFYRHHKLNHQKLFSSLAGWRGPWVLTEDDSQIVRRLALCYRFSSRQALTGAENKKANELVLWRERTVF
jgi:site-specific DNA-adenine methylase